MTGARVRSVLPSIPGDATALVNLQPQIVSREAPLLSWRDAHRVANLAASQAHGRLRVDLTGTRVDVLRAIQEAGIEVMWRPMPSLFGAYLNEAGNTRGILLNSGLPRGARRHTAAHELGHAWLEHSTSVDDGSTIDTVVDDEVAAVAPASRRRAWPDQEKTAEAFAAWFLMPRRVVAAALGVLDLTRPRSADDVYRLSLLLGTSYRSTLRHLPDLRLASRATCATWASTAPGSIKMRLDNGAPRPDTRRPEVWVLGERFDGRVVDLEPGDRLVVDHDASVAIHAPDWLHLIAQTAAAAPRTSMTSFFEVGPYAGGRTGALECPGAGAVGWAVRLAAAAAPLGLDPRGPA